MTIRKAYQHDFPAIFALMKEFSVFQKTPEKVSVTLEQMIQDKNLFQCLVAEDNYQQIAGFASYFFAYYSWSGKALYLDDLYVTDAFRKQSVGQRLFDSVIDIAKQEHCKKVRWLVSGWNQNAIDFYKKKGAIIDNTDMVCDLSL